MTQIANQEKTAFATDLPVSAPGLADGAMAEADMTRIKYGAWLIGAAFILLGVVFGVAVWRYTTASDVVAVVGSVATVAGTILGAFFGAQVGSAGKEAAEARRAQAERTTRLALGKLDPQVADDLMKKV
ncbi:MAG: hypothetical protein LBV34_04780 [Nocardiopsaceae bacterium]|jgi:hypothetical protein|nr:hypothetical protein [Nocardiopsaceae bacterium]